QTLPGSGHGGPEFEKPAISALIQKFFDKYLKGADVEVELIPESEIAVKPPQPPAAQPAPVDKGMPATTNVPGAEYPKVYEDGRVTFQLKAPDVKTVKVQPRGADNGLGS